MELNYANKKTIHIEAPEYDGEYYEDFVPATLDIAERASLAVNGLTETLDPEYDYELYWTVDLLGEEPVMYHSVEGCLLRLGEHYHQRAGYPQGKPAS